MKSKYAILLLFLAVRVLAVDRITATVTITSGTSDGQTLTVNGNVRTWKTTVATPSTQILLDATAAISKTNLFNQVALTPYSQIDLLDNGAASVKLVGNSGLAMAVSFSAAYATVSYSTQLVATMTGVRVPISGEPTGGQATNIASLLVTGENDLSTNKFYENAITVSRLMGLSNAQTVAGAKVMTNVAGQFWGIVSNSPAISGNVDTLTNGVYRGGFLIAPVISNAPAISGTVVGLTNGFYQAPYLRAGVASNMIAISGNVLILTNGLYKSSVLDQPIMTNGASYGGFRSPGAGTASEQYGNGAVATGSSSVALGNAATAAATEAIAIGAGVTADQIEAIAIGAASGANADSAIAIGFNAQAVNAHSSAIGANTTTTADNQLMFGTSSEHAHFPGNVRIDGNTELTWKRAANSSLANGNNAAIVVGTNTFVEVSGPSGAFTINGIAGGRDGKYIIILNQTGFDMTIAHQSGTDPTAANRIITMSGADRATTANGAVTLIYSGAASRWILLSLDP